MGAICCCVRSDPYEDLSSPTPSLDVPRGSTSPSYDPTQQEPIRPGEDIDADPSEAHHCAFCQSFTIDIQDESASSYSFEFSNIDDTYDMMRDCALFKRLADDISFPLLDSSAIIHAQVS